MGLAAESTQYVEMASLTALMCARPADRSPALLKLGFIANFLSRSVLIGFLTGVGIQVAMGQVGGMFGVPMPAGGTHREVRARPSARSRPRPASRPSSCRSSVLVMIVGLGRVNKKIPGALIAVVVTIVASYLARPRRRGRHRCSARSPAASRARPADRRHHPGNIQALLPTVISLVVVILAQSAATSRAYAMKYGDSFDENVDLVGLGLANVAAGITGTFVVNGSPTKTEMVDGAGGRSQISQLTAAAIVVVVLLFLTGPLSYMPNAVLAAVVFLIGVRLVDYLGMADILPRCARASSRWPRSLPPTVVVVGVEQGIILAMALSIIEHIYHSLPSVTTSSSSPGRRARPTPVAGRHRACARARGLPVWREPVLRERDPVHREDRRHRRERRPAAALARA